MSSSQAPPSPRYEAKIADAACLREIGEAARAAGQRVVLAHGVFDAPFHPGHARLIEWARSMGDVLVVSVVPDRFVAKGPDRPRLPERVRATVIASLPWTTHVVLTEEAGPWSIIRALKPHVYAKGADCRPLLDDPNSGLNQDVAVLREVGAELQLIDHEYLDIHSSHFLNPRG